MTEKAPIAIAALPASEVKLDTLTTFVVASQALPKNSIVFLHSQDSDPKRGRWIQETIDRVNKRKDLYFVLTIGDQGFTGGIADIAKLPDELLYEVGLQRRVP